MANAARKIDDIPEPTYTKWYNPLDTIQRVKLPWIDGRQRTIAWDPGETKELPSHFDSAINQVENGVVIGGLARQLVNMSLPEDRRPRVHEAFDSRLQARLDAEARAAAAALQSRAAETAALIAAQRLIEHAPQEAKPGKK